MIEIPADLHPDCVPLAWLLGSWEGAGVGDYPTIEAFRFGQAVSFGYVPDKAFPVRFGHLGDGAFGDIGDSS